MIFEVLNESAERGELILVDGGMCHWHLRRDGQITIREILVQPIDRLQGIGREMVEKLTQVQGATSIFAKCPINLPANGWYRHLGFADEGSEWTKSGRELRRWRLQI